MLGSVASPATGFDWVYSSRHDLSYRMDLRSQSVNPSQTCHYSPRGHISLAREQYNTYGPQLRKTADNSFVQAA